MNLHSFTFNPFQENMYILWDDTKETVIVDPGCYNASDQKQVATFVEQNDLNVVALLNTHCHIDHIFGNAFVVERFNVPFYMHEKDLPVLQSGQQTSMMYGLNYDTSPNPKSYLVEGEDFSFGETTLKIRFTPGHSPGSVCFIHHESKTVIGGDVLFKQSVGRTDLPGGDSATLINSIRTELFTLSDDFTVHSGHGPETTIGFEKQYNPFLNGTY